MNQLVRDMKLRHLMMIAFGGAIGTGLFVGTGGIINQTGPLGTIIAYIVGSIMIYSVMLSLGELASSFPTAGSFGDYAYVFINPSTGYMIFWLYWFGWVITAAAEYIAVGFLMQYWLPDVPVYYWVILCIVIIFLLNSFNIKIFAEGEFTLSLIKTLAVVIFLILGCISIIYHLYLTDFSEVFKNFYTANSNEFFPKGAGSVFSAILVAIFAFTGTEVIGVAVGETKNPSIAMPKAIRATLLRLVIFFIGSIVIISTFLPMNDSSITKSPFVSVLELMRFPYFDSGIPYAASIMNFIILTALLSTANSGLYGASRMIYGLANKGMYFPIFSKVNKRGIPIYALYFSMVFSLIALSTRFFNASAVMDTLIAMISLTVIVVWFSVSIAQYRFRKQYIKAGNDVSKLPYKAPFVPLIQIITIIGCVIALLSSFFDITQRIAFYSTIIYIILCYLMYFFTKKRFYKTKEIYGN